MPERHEEDLMEPQPDPAARSPHLNGALARLGARLDWYWTLSPPGRAAFWATFGGWALDAYNQMTVGFVLPAVTAAFALSPAQAGLLGSVGMVTSAVGGALAGALADAVGRVRVLILSIASYAIFTLLAGCAQSYEQLLVFLTLQGLGFGGEWAAGAVLVAEYAQATQRGRVVGAVQSAWSIGYAGVLIANTLVFSLAAPELAWRIMFWLGAVPAVVLLWVRTRVQESPVYRAEVAARGAGTGRAGAKPASARPGSARPGGALVGLFRRDQLRVTLASALLSVGVIGAGLVVWLPTYLEQVRHLTVEGLSAYMGIQVIGGFVGCVSAGYLLDALGRRRGLALFALGSALSAWAYVVLPGSAAWLVFAIGFPLGFFGSGIFSGLAVYLAELYPTELRGAGQGFGYNIGRGIGAVGPAAIGVAAARVGLSDALALAATSYGLCLVALLFLPETRGKPLAG
jgi:MFS family permease